MGSGGSRGALLVAGAALILAAAGLRLYGLGDVDLFCDEAEMTGIAASLWDRGELNNFYFSRTLPDRFFRNGIYFYYPPLSYVAAAPFSALRTTVGANIAPRLPALLAGLLLMVLLPPAARAIFADSGVGLAAAALTVCNGFQIDMSRMAVPYTLLPPLLLLTLIALLRALRRDRVIDWIGTGLGLTASAYVSQVAVFFWAMAGPCALATLRHRRTLRRVVTCFAASGAAYLVWIAWLPRAGFFANSFFETTANYRFTAQLGKILGFYRQMLAPWPLALVFTIGIGRLAVDLIGRRDLARILVLFWLLLPSLILLTRSMWILDYHLYFVYPPLILIVAYGACAAAPALDGRRRAMAVTSVVAMLCWLEWRFAPPAPSRASLEFGSPQIVSRMTAYIRRHDRGEPVIAPIGETEAYYLERFVRSKHGDSAVAECLALVSREPAWVFMGDNYFDNGSLDECDRFVRAHGTLVLHSAPIPGSTDAGNPLGYALYHLDTPERRP